MKPSPLILYTAGGTVRLCPRCSARGFVVTYAAPVMDAEMLDAVFGRGGAVWVLWMRPGQPGGVDGNTEYWAEDMVTEDELLDPELGCGFDP